MYALKPRQIGLVMILTSLVLSCDVAGGLFSQSEMADMYEVWVTIDGLPLTDGVLVRSGSPLVPVIESHGGASTPERLSLVLVDMNGAEAARLTFMSESGSHPDPDDPSMRTVRSMSGALPSFSIPDKLSEGYYYLETRLYDSTSRILTNSTTLVLLFNGAVPNPRIETYPSSPAKGKPVFLRLVSGLPEGLDPWLRWYVGGGMHKEGYASDFADRLVWQIPESDGFFNVRAELFPFKPPAAATSRAVSSVKPQSSAFRADLILAINPEQAASPLDGLERASLMDFKSDPQTQVVGMPDGTTLQPVMIGSPYLESHEYGYGHALQAGAGYLIPGSIVPRASSPFTLSVNFDPAASTGATGAIVTLYEADGTSAFLRLGISGGLPYLEAGDHIVQAFTSLPAGLLHLVLEVVPSELDATEAIVSLFLNNTLVGNGIISGRLFARTAPGMTLVGGPEGLDAVYDELSVMSGRYQAFFVARAQEYGSSLVAASGFEGGVIGKGISAQGPAETGDGYIELPLEASLEMPVPAGGFSVDIEGHGAPPALVLVMSDGSLLNLPMGKDSLGVAQQTDPMSVMGAGPEIVAGTDSGDSAGIAAGTEAGTSLVSYSSPTGWQASSNQSISLSVEAVSGGLRISDDAGKNVRIPTALSAAILRVQPASSAPVTIQTIMVRAFSSVDSANRAALITPVPKAEVVN